MYLFSCVRMNNEPSESYQKVFQVLNDYNLDQNIDIVKVSGIPEAKLLKPIKKESGYYSVLEMVGYWRKCSEIHEWFVTNVQDNKDDCNYYLVSKQKLLELLNLCTKIISNKSLASQ